MTTDLEKKFFETFGITYPCRFQYPEITETHYLELICVYNRYDSPIISNASEIENLKMHILNSLIIAFASADTDELKHQVQELFKE